MIWMLEISKDKSNRMSKECNNNSLIEIDSIININIQRLRED